MRKAARRQWAAMPDPQSLRTGASGYLPGRKCEKDVLIGTPFSKRTRKKQRKRIGSWCSYL